MRTEECRMFGERNTDKNIEILKYGRKRKGKRD